MYLNSGATSPDTITFDSQTKHAGSISNDVSLSKLEWMTPPPLKQGQDARFRLHINSRLPFSDISFAIGFSQPHGNRLVTFDSDFSGARESLKECGEFTREFCIEQLPLAPGVYGIDVGIRSGDMHGLFYRENCCLIDVVPSPNTPTYMTSYPALGFE